MFSADENVINAFVAGIWTWQRWMQKSCMTAARNPAWAVYPTQYELVGWLNACQILTKFKHGIIALMSLTAVLQISSMWDIMSSFLKRKKLLPDYIFFFKSHSSVKRGCANIGLLLPGSTNFLHSSFRAIDVVWKLLKCVLWQVSSKLPMAFDVAFQPDPINFTLAFLGERLQRIPTNNISFEALILNKTVPCFFFHRDSASYEAPWGNLWDIWKGAVPNWMGDGSCPSSNFAIEVQNHGAS